MYAKSWSEGFLGSRVKVQGVDPHATVQAVVTAVSPIKPTRYFEGEISDGEVIIRIVGFDQNKREQLFLNEGKTVIFSDCIINLTENLKL